ncbi:MAG: hypothetical protein ACOCTT_03495 [archaeon]
MSEKEELPELPTVSVSKTKTTNEEHTKTEITIKARTIKEAWKFYKKTNGDRNE